MGRFWIEGLRTDSLYLFNWPIAGQPIRVSQVLSLVLMIAALAVLFYNIRLHPHKPEELYVNIVAAHKLTDSYDVAIGGNIPLTTALLLGTQLDNMKVGIDLIDSLNTRKNFIFSPG